MAVKASSADVLREAMRDLHSNETFEKALGRVVRKHGGTFKAYMELIDLVRKHARKHGTTLMAAATAIADGES